MMGRLHLGAGMTTMGKTDYTPIGNEDSLRGPAEPEVTQ